MDEITYQVPATAAERRAAFDAVRGEVRSLHAVEQPDEAQRSRMDAALDEFELLEKAVQADELRAARIERAQGQITDRAVGSDAPAQINRNSPFGDTAKASRQELRDRALRAAELNGKHLSAAQQSDLERQLSTRHSGFDGISVARRLLVTESEEYKSAFVKGMSGGPVAYTQDEARALNEYRAASEGTDSAGGFGLPVLIDPTIILTSGASVAPILDIARTVTITTDAWKGVNSAPPSWSYDAEAAEVSDDMTTLAQPNIPVYKAAGFIPFSIEVGADYPDLQGEMARLLEAGYLDLMADKTANGTGSAEPYGIFAKMADTTTSPAHVTVTTAGTLGAVDVRSAWSNLPERFRSRATWIMHAQVENIVRAFGNNNALADFTVNFTAENVSLLAGRPIRLTDYAPQFTNTTATESALVVGDFSQFVVVKRAGMSVELVPHLLHTSNNRPSGQRGWYAYARIGHDVATANAFRLLANS